MVLFCLHRSLNRRDNVVAAGVHTLLLLPVALSVTKVLQVYLDYRMFKKNQLSMLTIFFCLCGLNQALGFGLNHTCKDTSI